MDSIKNKALTLEELKSTIDLVSNLDDLRINLYKQFCEKVEYKDILEWNELVVICEVLAYIGWGDKEQIDAKSRFNGDCWETSFNNKFGTKRLRHARWKKRKKG